MSDNRERPDEAMSALAGLVLLLTVGVVAYAVLGVVLGFFGLDLPVPDWLWNLGDRLIGT